jgi:hypothetical protein
MQYKPRDFQITESTTSGPPRCQEPQEAKHLQADETEEEDQAKYDHPDAPGEMHQDAGNV